MSEVPSPTTVEYIGQWIWLFIEPVKAVWSGYNPWTVVGSGLVLSLIPVPGRTTCIKVLAAVLITYAAYSLRPLYYGLRPLWPDPLDGETYIRLGFLLIEAVFVIGVMRLMLDNLRTLVSAKLTQAAQTLPLNLSQATCVFKRQIDDLVPTSLNFTLQVAAPVALPVTQTISVPRKLSSPDTPR